MYTRARTRLSEGSEVFIGGKTLGVRKLVYILYSARIQTWRTPVLCRSLKNFNRSLIPKAKPYETGGSLHVVTTGPDGVWAPKSCKTVSLSYPEQLSTYSSISNVL